jgi:hypothetical protein
MPVCKWLEDSLLFGIGWVGRTVLIQQVYGDGGCADHSFLISWMNWVGVLPNSFLKALVK